MVGNISLVEEKVIKVHSFPKLSSAIGTDTELVFSVSLSTSITVYDRDPLN